MSESVPTEQGGVHGFPAVLATFIGRDAVVGEVAGLLEERRLVTVTGPGGSGKTRLAGQVAERAASRFADGAWLIELASVADPGQVSVAVAASLGIQEQPGVPAELTLAKVLARQQVLLVIDNCEHVISAAAQLCAGLLAACDDVRVLATSREPLAVPGEARYRLGPLSLPGDDSESEAVALFADRARRADARFVLDEVTGPEVGRLVRRLDGMPLAIELAAARVEALGVRQLLGYLDETLGFPDDRFELLAGADRLAAGRHRSLAATVEWSYRLLDEEQRRVFRRLSAFPGPFTLEAAAAVAGADSSPSVLYLVDCSLLSPPHAGADGRARYQMLETLRAYGAKKLAEAGEGQDAAGALAAYAIEVARQAESGLLTNSPREVAAARWLDAEDALMRWALTWALDHDPAAAARLAAVLGWWWRLRGRLASQYGLLGEITARTETGSDDWCAAQLWLSRAATQHREHTAALEQATALAEAAAARGPCRALADGLTMRATALANLERADEATGEARRALQVAREAGDRAAELYALGVLAAATSRVGDLEPAVQIARQAAQITDGVPGMHVRWAGYVLTNILIRAGDSAAAGEVCAAMLARARDAGDVTNQWKLLPYMVTVDLHAGRIGDAAAHLREGLQGCLRTGIWVTLHEYLGCCGYLCAATGRPAEALTMWAAHIALLAGQTGYALNYGRYWVEPRRAARQKLGPGRAQHAEDRGAAMSLIDAAEYALTLIAPTAPQALPAGLAALSARERELVVLVARGRTDAQIAAELSISVSTVRTHLDRIRDKTGCRRRADLTRLALQAELADPPSGPSRGGTRGQPSPQRSRLRKA
ncbi:LuxR C-terminal-related transcriptional regulator [Amycolatopsis rhabdoformis]|uniref:LuxR C-terminal-related transcriptional regulator n=1 Tax=Amycolatopsis rhabdoformis TaxID=1448059 RepID=A0ABZ1IDI0_9PSEU|nr:LuxR C-terminal-related transcriptional regulator [Amycolatopsis rhabdoformis]WSE32124.1 LuxR C-terminal-related transcriptional regulator [Amycolatopsis rhabdoformis]